jgi:hypothetical protein
LPEQHGRRDKETADDHRRRSTEREDACAHRVAP